MTNLILSIYSYNRAKVTSCHLIGELYNSFYRVSDEFTDNDGGSFTSGNIPVNATTNSVSDGAPAIRVALWHYETQAHFTQDDVNSEVLDLGGVWAGNQATPTWGVEFVSSLIGKVVTNNQDPRSDNIVGLSGYNIRSSLNDFHPQFAPKHIPITLGYSNNSPACKTLDYLSDKNGTGALFMAYKEMAYDSNRDSLSDAGTLTGGNAFSGSKGDLFRLRNFNNDQFNELYIKLSSDISTTWAIGKFDQFYIHDGVIYTFSGVWSEGVLFNGNGWGDNNQFEITDNQSTLADTNGTTVLYGTASFNTQYFIVEE